MKLIFWLSIFNNKLMQRKLLTITEGKMLHTINAGVLAETKLLLTSSILFEGKCRVSISLLLNRMFVHFFSLSTFQVSSCLVSICLSFGDYLVDVPMKTQTNMQVESLKATCIELLQSIFHAPNFHIPH